MSYLKNIRRLYGKGNMGGVLTLYVCSASDVLTIPDPVAKVIPGDIVFKAGAGFVRWDVTLESPRIKSTSRSSREGSAKSNRLTFMVPRDRQDIASMFDMAEDDTLIVVAKDGNGTVKLFGTPDSPLIFRYDQDSGQQFANGNFYSCEFSFDGPDNIYFYTGALQAQPAGTAPSIVQFSTGELIASLNPSDELIVSSDFAHSFTLVPGTSASAAPALVKWDDGSLIASLQPGDTLVVDTDFSFDFEIIGSI